MRGIKVPMQDCALEMQKGLMRICGTLLKQSYAEAHDTIVSKLFLQDVLGG